VPAVLTLAFDPVVVLSDTSSVRLETIALALVLFVGLLLAVWIGRRDREAALRIDDLVFMVVGAVPGAIVGGRLGYVLDHWSYYQANTGAIADPAQGGFTLSLAVPLGLLTGSIIGRLLGAPIGRWLHALALPLLFVLAGGKIAGILGGTGQGQPSDLPWATSYLGAGPWGSIAADVPSHPSQAYEAVAVMVVVVALWLVSRAPALARRDGGLLWAALGLWAVARFVVGFSWRDPAAVGPLRAEQLLALAVVLLAVAGLAERTRAARRRSAPGPAALAAAEPATPAAEPATLAAAEPATLDPDAAARAEAEAMAEADTPVDPDATPA
jgi:phosphatidylglycerol:prolipoprotein diacylglycerol transferase